MAEVSPVRVSRIASHKTGVCWLVTKSEHRVNLLSASRPSVWLVSGIIRVITWCHRLSILVSITLISTITAEYCLSRVSSAATLSTEGKSGTGVEARGDAEDCRPT
jgi:hypothetical protein